MALTSPIRQRGLSAIAELLVEDIIVPLCSIQLLRRKTAVTPKVNDRQTFLPAVLCRDVIMPRSSAAISRRRRHCYFGHAAVRCPLTPRCISLKEMPFLFTYLISRWICKAGTNIFTAENIFKVKDQGEGHIVLMCECYIMAEAYIRSRDVDDHLF